MAVTTEDIKELYREYLGREPLQSGIDAWKATGQSLSQVAAGISRSPEAAVYRTYEQTLGRSPQMQERQAWVNQINTTGSVQQAVDAIVRSPEAQNRQGMLLASTRELKPAFVAPPTTTTPMSYSGDGSIAGSVFTSSSGLTDSDTVRGYSTNITQTNDTELGDPLPGTIDPILQQFNTLMSKYIEGFEDEQDRIYRQEAANEWKDALETGDIDVIKAVDVSALEDIPGWSEYYSSVVGTTEDTTTEATTTPAADADDNFLGSVLDKMPDDLRDFIKNVGEDPLEVLKNVLDTMPDITDQLKRGQVGVEVIFDDWKESNIFGPFMIPGLPLPPGIIDVTYEDIEKAVETVGGSINDVIDGIKEGNAEEAISKVISDAGTWVKDTVGGVVSGVADDPFGGTLGGLGDWVTGVLGQVIGGSVLADIYDDISGFFDPDNNTLIVPGGTTTDEDEDSTEEKTALQGDDIYRGDLDREGDEVVRPDDIFTDTTADSDDDLLFGGRTQEDVVDGRRDLPFPGGDDDRRQPDPDEIGTDRDVVDRDADIFIPDPEPPEPDPIVIGGGDQVVVDPEPPEPDPIVIGGGDQVVLEPEPEDPDEIGGPEPTPSSGGGGGGGGGSAGGTTQPFLRGLSYTPTVPVAIRQQAPVDFAAGLLTAPAPVQPSGLMRPTNSMGAIGQLILRNLA